MSSDIDEIGEEGEVSPTGICSPNEEDTKRNSGRRGSLPSDRPSTGIRRHLPHFGKARRKISAPNGSQHSTAKSATSSPLEPASGYPLAELLERLRPAASNRPSSSIDSGVVDFFDPPARHRHFSCGSSSPSRKSGSTDDGFGFDDVKRPLFIDTRLANIAASVGPATVPRRCLYYRQSSVSGVADDSSHCARQRSNSEAGVSEISICINF